MSVKRRLSKHPPPLVALALLISASASSAQTPTAAASPPCSPWVNSGGDHSNGETPDLGCSNGRNLEGMLDSKSDLERGRELGPADANRERLAITNYEEGKVKDSSTGATSPGALMIPTAKPQETSQ
jgi:type IV pilus biogenesis protein CpaD/CtpE